MSQSEVTGAAMPAVIEAALLAAGQAFSALIESPFVSSELACRRLDLAELPGLLGDEAMPVTAGFFEVRGDLSGYLLLLMPSFVAERLTTLLLGADAGEEALADSALGEIGNVVVSAFLNRLADAWRLSAAPTPPQVIHDMAGALLGTVASALSALGESQVTVIRTTLTEALSEGNDASVVEQAAGVARRSPADAGTGTILLWLPRSEELARMGWAP